MKTNDETNNINGHNMAKNLVENRPVGYFTNMGKELDSELPRTKPASCSQYGT